MSVGETSFAYSKSGAETTFGQTLVTSALRRYRVENVLWLTNRDEHGVSGDKYIVTHTVHLLFVKVLKRRFSQNYSMLRRNHKIRPLSPCIRQDEKRRHKTELLFKGKARKLITPNRGVHRYLAKRLDEISMPNIVFQSKNAMMLYIVSSRFNRMF
ncbi:hypothetical protein BD560DRAFT_425002 [Blakeslea trispora]|nr:hypothetical protein BD560DRAFT_425002 [Blakeslea trispora]